jgi:hypothetical protein
VALLVLAVVASSASSASCGGKSARPAAPSAKGEAPPAVAEVTPSRLLPELVGARGLVAGEEGQRRILVDRMRLLVRGDGSLDRAAELLPRGNVSSIALPSRLGGGYLFHVNAGGGTEIWRAQSWLGKLRPLTRRGETVADIVPGFDRLYLRLSSGNRIIAVHPESGALLPLGPLPAAGSYGQLAFADGWRAVVDTDLRGPLATFDAGVTWRPLNLGEKPQAVGIVDGDPAVFVAGARHVVNARGMVTRRSDTRGRRGDDSPEPAAKKGGPLGPRPLRAAVEDGWPDGRGAALVARGGALGRVSLKDGAVLTVVEDAYPERRAACHAIRLGQGLGFLCGERDGATAVYAHVPPLAMAKVMRFDKPRFVAASGNGALVIRGRCEGEAAEGADADARWYCIRSVTGATREIRVKGFDLGVERIVGLADGRVAVLVPPRGGSPGDLSLVAADGSATKVELKLPEEPRDAARQLRRGLWLDGFEERSPGVLGGWVEAGGPVVGVEIALDGKVKAGEVQEGTGAVFAGRFAVVMMDGARAVETRDGGMSYRSFDLPDREEEARAVPSRGASPVGAALPGWVRVGWGEAATPDDMKQADSPTTPSLPLKVSPTLRLACDVASVATPPLPEKPRATAPPMPYARPRPGVRVPPRHDSGPTWNAFRNTAPPAIGPDDAAIEGRAGGDAPLHAYAWGKRGADWTRAGRWLMRFDDRFDASGGVRSAGASAALWADEMAAQEALSNVGYQSISWSGSLDPGGRALLAAGCRGSSCALYAVAEGQPVLPIRDAHGRAAGLPRPVPGGAVRHGDTWFFLTGSSYEPISLWRLDLGVARQIGTYFRPGSRYDTPRLVRRAQGGALGVLIQGQPDPGEKSGVWYVIPLDPETGALGEATPLMRRDLAGTALTRCAPEQDGWLIDLSPDAPVLIELDNARSSISGDSLRARVRLDPGRACVDAFAADGGSFYGPEPKAVGRGPAPAAVALTAPPAKKAPPPGAVLVPLAVTERATGRRWGLSCQVNPPQPAAVTPKTK